MTENVCFGDVLERVSIRRAVFRQVITPLALDLSVSFAVKLAHVLSIVKYF